MPLIVGTDVVPLEMGPTLTPWSPESLGGELAMHANSSANPATAAYIAASRALFVPFRVNKNTSYDRMYTMNGTTASDSIDVGIYNEELVRLVSKGLTLQAGTSTLQLFSFAAAVTLGSGRYYMALCMNGTTGTIHRSNNIPAQDLRGFGIFQQDLSGEAVPGTLPATATPAAPGSAWMPNFGVVRTGFTI